MCASQSRDFLAAAGFHQAGPVVKCAASHGEGHLEEEGEPTMKRVLAIVVSAVATAAFAQQPSTAPNPPASASVRVAVIDVQTLVMESAAGKEAKARLQKLADEKRTERAKMTDEFDALQKQIQTQATTLSDSKIADLRKQLDDKKVAIDRFDDDAKQQLDDAQRKELDALEQQIMPIIKELGQEMKLTLIFNKFQSGLVYADPSTDITDIVLKRFNTRVTTPAAPGK
jgi:outer membrane protein